MLAHAKPDTGILTPLLRYPSGGIYHSGKVRQPGARGWDHLDHGKGVPTFKTVTEIENSCGCCMLIRRKAFYDAAGFDENIFLYCEDDALSMEIRRAGYRILFVPEADGIHEEGQTNKQFANIGDIMQESQRYFGFKYGRYLDHNANRVPLGNFEY
jgi:GT2 family glycosyltransferase